MQKEFVRVHVQDVRRKQEEDGFERFVVMLREVGGDRALPIWIGPTEGGRCSSDCPATRYRATSRSSSSFDRPSGSWPAWPRSGSFGRPIEPSSWMRSRRVRGGGRSCAWSPSAMLPVARLVTIGAASASGWRVVAADRAATSCRHWRSPKGSPSFRRRSTPCPRSRRSTCGGSIATDAIGRRSRRRGRADAPDAVRGRRDRREPRRIADTGDTMARDLPPRTERRCGRPRIRIATATATWRSR